VADVRTLSDYAAELLVACETALATTDGGFDKFRSYVSPGAPALDCCPQLTVHVGGLSLDQTSPTTPVTAPGHKLTTTGQLILATLVITVARCVPLSEENRQIITLPTPASLTAVADLIDQDIWAIWNTVANMARAGELFGGRCPALYFDPPVPLTTEGGCAGWTMSVRAAISGYPTDGS
jgi:hypothetical protein